MLGELPLAALIAADAGFVGYELLRTVIDSGRHVLVRVGSNVRLLKKLGWAKESAGTVYLWPDRAAQKNQPPLARLKPRLGVAPTVTRSESPYWTETEERTL